MRPGCEEWVDLYLHGVDRDNINFKWKKVAVVQFKILSWCLTGEGKESKAVPEQQN